MMQNYCFYDTILSINHKPLQTLVLVSLEPLKGPV